VVRERYERFMALESRPLLGCETSISSTAQAIVLVS
jgi:hypothetical protein